MSEATIFLVGVGLTATAAALVVWYLRPHLYSILVDLCGTTERARFWMAFSNVTLLLVPVVFAMSCRPGGNDVSVVFRVTSQLRWSLIGFVVLVIALGLVISRFIPRTPQPRLEKAA